MSRYRDLHARSLADPESFWAEQAEALHWERPFDRVLNADGAPFYRWFEGGRLNTCYNAVDRHVEAGHGQRTAIIHDSPVTGAKAKLTYAELRDQTARLAGVLQGFGVAKGDRVVVYMAMVPEALVAMLACARIGAVHSVVFGGFAANELAKRIDDAKPKAILATSCGVEPGRVVAYKPLVDRAIEIAAHKPDNVLVLQRPEGEGAMQEGRDHDWRTTVDAAGPVACVPLEATDPLYILYTSGTTGTPKGVVRDNGGHAAALAWSMKGIYGIGPGDVFWTASDVGWVVGHSYIVYAPLLVGATTVVFEGKPVGTPDAGAFWRVIEEHGVKALFTAPTAFRAIRKEDPEASHLKRHDLPRFERLYLAGERCDPDTLAWAQAKLGVPVIDHWWQTETGWAIAANPVGIEALPVKPGSATLPMPGYDVRILAEDGAERPAGTIGAIAIRLPLAPGCLTTLWRADERYENGYLVQYPGHYFTGDSGYKDEDGYCFVMGRMDDVINVAGHRLSTGGLEEVLASHPDVAECAVLGVEDSLKGQLPLGLVVLKANVDKDTAVIEREIVAKVREEVGPVAAFKLVAVVPRLPKTRSGKILRATVKQLADGTEVRVPATIDDPAILDEIKAKLQAMGYAKSDAP